MSDDDSALHPSCSLQGTGSETLPSLVQFDLDGALNTEELSAEFAARGRVLIPRVLRVDCAIALSKLLGAESGWGLSLEAGAGGRRFLQGSVREDLSPLQMREIFDAAYSDVGRSYSHLYETISLTTYHNKGSRAAASYARFLEFVNSDTFLHFVRAVSGIKTICAATPVACRYSHGHFYALHVDENGGGDHRASFVLNLTPFWEPQWGGLLQFRGERGEVEEAYLPRFNSLSLFMASQPHSVSLVSPCAPHPRLSMTGALIAPEGREGEPNPMGSSAESATCALNAESGSHRL